MAFQSTSKIGPETIGLEPLLLAGHGAPETGRGADPSGFPEQVRGDLTWSASPGNPRYLFFDVFAHDFGQMGLEPLLEDRTQ